MNQPRSVLTSLLGLKPAKKGLLLVKQGSNKILDMYNISLLKVQTCQKSQLKDSSVFCFFFWGGGMFS